MNELYDDVFDGIKRIIKMSYYGGLQGDNEFLKRIRYICNQNVRFVLNNNVYDNSLISDPRDVDGCIKTYNVKTESEEILHFSDIASFNKNDFFKTKILNVRK